MTTRELRVSDRFTRTTSTVHLHGEGETGRGEDVIYETAFHEYPAALLDGLTGTDTIDEFSAGLEDAMLFEPNQELAVDRRGHRRLPAKRNFRRWALESAALDLALRQRDTTLADLLGRSYDPVRFVVSPSNDEQTPAYIERLIDRVPGVELKLNATAEWDPDTIAEIASFDRTRVVDFKSHHDQLGVDPDPELYRTVASGFADAILEDPVVTPATRSAFDGVEDRVAWDKPIDSVESVASLPFEPSQVNVKPSRFGSLRSLFETIEYCRDNDIDLYGGGQFELGVGREHVHALASLFYPDAPNDVAPSVYNGAGIPDEPIQRPLAPAADLRGLSWRRTPAP
ncbi:hypothetical protein ACOZ4I_17790 (plasmid) [Haloarcula salina]|uniref:hypothetical protein n=1 Tax=Haloarcula salina TaxID=1429914 RepID=UPI003C7035CC